MDSGPNSGRLPRPASGPQSGRLGPPNPAGPKSGAMYQPPAAHPPEHARALRLSLLPLEHDHVIRVRCDGVVTTRGLPPHADPLQALLGPNCYGHRVVLSLERAQSADTSGITWLVDAGDRFRQSGGRLVLYALPPTVRQMFDILGLSGVVSSADAEAEALRLALAAPAAANGHPH